MHRQNVGPSVGVFDVDLPPGIAFVRSLGRAGINTTTFHERAHPPARYSRYSNRFKRSPKLFHADRFAHWLTGLLRKQQLDLIAPTSDYIAWYIAHNHDSFHPSVQQRLAPPGGVKKALFKDEFTKAMAATDLPTPPTCAPGTLEEARYAARALGYPIVLKPRSHVGIGRARGLVVRDEAELEAAFHPFGIIEGNTTVEKENPQLAFPLLQKYIDSSTSSIVSISGFMSPEGHLAAVTYAVKRAQWPPRLGVGTVFETIERPPFATSAIEAVRTVIGHGIFELEVMHDVGTGEAYSLDLNPRGFGQMSLDSACGADLPQLWYRSMMGFELKGQHVSQPGIRWAQSVPYYLDALARVTMGPGRLSVGAEYAKDLLKRRVDVAHTWSDPLPGVLLGLQTLRHPRSILRSYLTDIEVSGK